MNLWQKSLAWILGVLVVLVGAYQVFLYLAFSDMCGNEVWANYPSPDGRLQAVVFQRDCGATTSLSTQVTILQANDDLPNRSGDVLVIDGDPDTVAPKISWLSDESLVIGRARTGDEYLAADSWESSSFWKSERVEIEYAR